jgi:hypothetical protein
VSVEEQLGVADLAQGLAEARQLWQGWLEHDSRLASAPAVDGLPDWLMLVGIDAADEVLYALVQIGSPSGRDCRPAAWVVAWALLPGANAVARRAPAGRETDALVASQLWLEIRQFPWWRHRKVAGNVLANMRSVLAREEVLKRSSWAERRTVPTDRLPEQQLRKQVSPTEELIDVLSWGEHVGFDRIWRSHPALLTGGADGSIGCPNSLSQRTGTDVSISVSGDGGRIWTVARDSAQTRAAEHRRAGVSLPVGPIRAVHMSAQAARTPLCRTQLSEPNTLPVPEGYVPPSLLIRRSARGVPSRTPKSVSRGNARHRSLIGQPRLAALLSVRHVTASSRTRHR